VREAQEMEQTRQEEETESESKRFTFIDMFRYPSVRWLTLMLTVVQLSINFLYYAPAMMLADFDFNIFINGAVLGAANISGRIFASLVIKKIKRKTMGILSFSTILVFSIILIFLWRPNDGE
jgi:hypothetical protein